MNEYSATVETVFFIQEYSDTPTFYSQLQLSQEKFYSRSRNLRETKTQFRRCSEVNIFDTYLVHKFF